jgi:hypothetical protein
MRKEMSAEEAKKLFDSLVQPKRGYEHKKIPNPVVGSIIVRPAIGYNDGRFEPKHVILQKTTKKSYMFKAHRLYRNTVVKSMVSHTPHYIVGSPTLVGELVCFTVTEDIPKNWTYFEVVAVGKKGKVLFVRPRVGNLRMFYCYPLRRPKLGSVRKVFDRKLLMEMYHARF